MSPTRGSYRLSILEKSTLVTAPSGSSVSAVDPPVSPARSVPPYRGLPAVDVVNALIVSPVPQRSEQAACPDGERAGQAGLDEVSAAECSGCFLGSPKR